MVGGSLSKLGNLELSSLHSVFSTVATDVVHIPKIELFFDFSLYFDAPPATESVGERNFVGIF